MDSNYDENVSENPFFCELQTEQADLFRRATQEGWIICVPRCGTIQRTTLTSDDLLSHILIPSDELPETHFRTINGKDVRVCNRVLTIEQDGIASTFSTHIIFEETFYTEESLKYKVWCLESPLEKTKTRECNSSINSVLTLRDCIDLLWTEGLGKEILENLDDSIKSFLADCPSLDACSLQTQKDLIGGLYSQCIQIAMRKTCLRGKTSQNKHLMDNIKTAVETYMQHGVYKQLFQGISTCTAYDDSNFNKTVRNLSDIQLRDLDVRPDLYETVPCAKQELAKINGYSTILGKVGCLRRTIAVITKRSVTQDNFQTFLSADELLPVFVFLIIKTCLPNWMAQLTFIKQFRFSSMPADEVSFLITTLEAAIEHIRSGALLGPQAPESQLDEGNDETFEMTNMNTYEKRFSYSDDNQMTVNYLFHQVRLANCETIKNILDKNKKFGYEKTETYKLCHPLCSCDKCERLLSTNLCDTTPTVHSCDDRGFTALHVACLYGRAKTVDLLLSYGANVFATDYSGATPLHYAAMRGHQNALLLLLHSNSDINAIDTEKNTPLHFASNNGHEGCVKALLYFSEQCKCKLELNCVNSFGDTPLHHASRWGYEGIVSILLEYGASVHIENKRKMTPLDCAHNIHISQLLFEYKSKKFESFVFVPLITNTKIDNPQLDFTDNEDSQCDSRMRKYSTSSEQGVRPQSAKQIKKVESLLRSIAFGDIHLACYHLGLPSPRNKVASNDDVSSASYCHPLCTCERCKPVTNSNAETRVNRNDTLSINVCNSDGYTPLHVASMHGWSEITRLLLDYGAAPNVTTKSKGYTPLHLACQNRRLQVIRELASAGGCILDIQDARGNTALHYSCALGDSRAADILVANGAGTEVKNAEGKTPIEEAEERMLISLVKLLKGGKKIELD